MIESEFLEENKKNIDLDCVKLAFNMVQKLNTQSLAFDFLKIKSIMAQKSLIFGGQDSLSKVSRDIVQIFPDVHRLNIGFIKIISPYPFIDHVNRSRRVDEFYSCDL